LRERASKPLIVADERLIEIEMHSRSLPVVALQNPLTCKLPAAYRHSSAYIYTVRVAFSARLVTMFACRSKPQAGAAVTAPSSRPCAD
jgi:hypothetical protein